MTSHSLLLSSPSFALNLIISYEVRPGRFHAGSDEEKIRQSRGKRRSYVHSFSSSQTMLDRSEFPQLSTNRHHPHLQQQRQQSSALLCLAAASSASQLSSASLLQRGKAPFLSSSFLCFGSAEGQSAQQTIKNEVKSPESTPKLADGGPIGPGGGDDGGGGGGGGGGGNYFFAFGFWMLLLLLIFFRDKESEKKKSSRKGAYY